MTTSYPAFGKRTVSSWGLTVRRGPWTETRSDDAFRVFNQKHAGHAEWMSVERPARQPGQVEVPQIVTSSIKYYGGGGFIPKTRVGRLQHTYVTEKQNKMRITPERAGGRGAEQVTPGGSNQQDFFERGNGLGNRLGSGSPHFNTGISEPVLPPYVKKEEKGPFYSEGQPQYTDPIDQMAPPGELNKVVDAPFENPLEEILKQEEDKLVSSDQPITDNTEKVVEHVDRIAEFISLLLRVDHERDWTEAIKATVKEGALEESILLLQEKLGVVGEENKLARPEGPGIDGGGGGGEVGGGGVESQVPTGPVQPPGGLDITVGPADLPPAARPIAGGGGLETDVKYPGLGPSGGGGVGKKRRPGRGGIGLDDIAGPGLGGLKRPEFIDLTKDEDVKPAKETEFVDLTEGDAKPTVAPEFVDLTEGDAKPTIAPEFVDLTGEEEEETQSDKDLHDKLADAMEDFKHDQAEMVSQTSEMLKSFPTLAGYDDNAEIFRAFMRRLGIPAKRIPEYPVEEDMKEALESRSVVQESEAQKRERDRIQNYLQDFGYNPMRAVGEYLKKFPREVGSKKRPGGGLEIYPKRGRYEEAYAKTTAANTEKVIRGGGKIPVGGLLNPVSSKVRRGGGKIPVGGLLNSKVRRGGGKIPVGGLLNSSKPTFADLK